MKMKLQRFHHHFTNLKVENMCLLFDYSFVILNSPESKIISLFHEELLYNLNIQFLYFQRREFDSHPQLHKNWMSVCVDRVLRLFLPKVLLLLKLYLLCELQYQVNQKFKLLSFMQLYQRVSELTDQYKDACFEEYKWDLLQLVVNQHPKYLNHSICKRIWSLIWWELFFHWQKLQNWYVLEFVILDLFGILLMLK